MYLPILMGMVVVVGVRKQLLVGVLAVSCVLLH